MAHSMSLRVVSFGGGKQSTALLVLAAQGVIPHRVFLFANVGEHAENPETLDYYDQHARPFADRHGIELTEVRWVDRKRRVRDLYSDLLSSRKSIDIPVRLASGAFGNRKCTDRYKIEVVAREVKRRGATVDDPAEVAIGISTDEIERAKPGVPKQQPWTYKTYPLLGHGLSRRDCVEIVLDAGLPEPPKSACWFCPFQSEQQWQHRRLTNPALFAKAEALEDTLNERRTALGKDRVGLASASAPLALAVMDQLSLDGGCDSGWCFT